MPYRRGFVEVVLLLCVSCTVVVPKREVTILSSDLNQRSLFIEEITYQLEGPFFAEEMCLAISPLAIWESGDTATQLRDQIASSTNITIDGELISSNRISYRSRPIEISVIEDGQVVGSHGGTLNICFSVAHLRSGDHTGHIQITASSGREFSDNWEFAIE